jgi:hypothetical protein
MPEFVRSLLLPVGSLVAAVGALLAGGVIEVTGAAGALIGMAAGMSVRPLARPSDPDRESRIALARARREEVEADLLIASAQRISPAQAVALAASLRVTDGVSLQRRGRRWELCAVLTGGDARQVVEERLRRVSPVPLAIGWARFPRDAVTFEGLVEHARPEVRDGERGRPRLVVPPAVRFGRWTARRQLLREEAQ